MTDKIIDIAKLITIWCFLAIFVTQVTRGYSDYAEKCTVKNDTMYVCDTVRIKSIPDTIHLNRVTTYNAVASQCDSNPLTTADGSRIDLNKLKDRELRWCALSRDLIKRWNGPFDYGDTLEVYSELKPWINGKWVVHDCMNARYKMSMDLLFDPVNNKPKLGIGKDVKIIIR